ncbi:translation initiation factor IF-2 [Candidatus Woesearchaeota archaeon]|nr:MAG: translation initiation factor IF-2 [Candidatus Woesearchaeota archaeon]
MSQRSPICTVLGHVDHGKSSILDAIRGSNILATEAGAITQAIGASIVPIDVINKVCAPLMGGKANFTIPGLLFIDTPGHAAFTSLRKRGGNLADIAVLVVDIREGFKPQTIEALEILKFYKTPFIVAANKIDLLPGWRSKPGSVLASINSQDPNVVRDFETKMYELVGNLSERGFNSERFDRVEDFTTQIGIVPISAKTKEGLAELLMVLSGLAQKFLEKRLEMSTQGPAKGTILEVKEERGLGKTMDVILYDGTLRVGDVLVIGSMNGPIITKVRALFEPASLKEMRDKKAKFETRKEVVSATGVKISCPDMEGVIAGMPIRSVPDGNVEEVAKELQKEIQNVVVETDGEGIIIKADTIGSLEAMVNLFREAGIKIRRASLGDVTKKDIIDAQANAERDPLTAVILCFNTNVPEDIVVPPEVRVDKSDIIYHLLERHQEWLAQKEKEKETQVLDSLVRPCKMKIMENFVFRQSNPAVVGVDVLVGKIKVGTNVTKDGTHLTSIKSIQKEKESKSVIEAGNQVAMSFPNVTVGRQVEEGDILFADIPEEDFKKLKELKRFLKDSELEVMRELAELKRKNNPVWGI